MKNEKTCLKNLFLKYILKTKKLKMYLIIGIEIQVNA